MVHVLADFLRIIFLVIVEEAGPDLGPHVEDLVAEVVEKVDVHRPLAVGILELHSTHIEIGHIFDVMSMQFICLLKQPC